MTSCMESRLDRSHQTCEGWQLRSMLDELPLTELTISTSASDLLLAACYESSVQDEVGPRAGPYLWPCCADLEAPPACIVDLAAGSSGPGSRAGSSEGGTALAPAGSSSAAAPGSREARVSSCHKIIQAPAATGRETAGDVSVLPMAPPALLSRLWQIHLTSTLHSVLWLSGCACTPALVLGSCRS